MNWSSNFRSKVLKILFLIYIIWFPTLSIYIVISKDISPETSTLFILVTFIAIMILTFYIYTIHRWVVKRNEVYTRGSIGDKGKIGEKVSNEQTADLINANKQRLKNEDFGVETGNITPEQAEFYNDSYFSTWKIKVKKSVLLLFKEAQTAIDTANEVKTQLNSNKGVNNDFLNTVSDLFNKYSTSSIDGVGSCRLQSTGNPSPSSQWSENTLMSKSKKFITCIDNSILPGLKLITKPRIRKAIRKFLKAVFHQAVLEYNDSPIGNNFSGSESFIYEEINKYIDKPTSPTEQEEFLDFVFKKLDNAVGTVNTMSLLAVNELNGNITDFREILKINNINI